MGRRRTVAVSPSPDPEKLVTAEELRRRFDAVAPYTVGLEDEIFLCDPDTFELVPCAEEALAALGDPRFRLELPAAQIEVATTPEAAVGAAAAQLADARRRLAECLAGRAVGLSAGVHPLSSGRGEVSAVPRYAEMVERYGAIARRQVVAALQVHVAVGDADRALAVYNAALPYLPLLAALAANGAYYEGADSDFASVRPVLGALLPRQGVPPPIASWEELADAFRWGARARRLTPAAWWWELRLHPAQGTLEFRVPDPQGTVKEAAAIAAVVQSLVVQLSEGHDAGKPPSLSDGPSWRIAENRFSACRDGVEGEMADLESGEPRPTRVWLGELLDELDPVAQRMGCAEELAAARRLVEVNGAIAQRRVAAEGGGASAVARWLASRFSGD